MADPSILQKDKIVRHFRQILLWPLQLMPISERAPIQKHWERLQTPGEDNPWDELQDEFTGDPVLFQERHYSEFVTFLPFVQRFLYGESKGNGAAILQGSSIRVFRRNDIAQVKMTFSDPHTEPLILTVAHVDLYFFYDIDLAILVVEVYGDEVPLPLVQNVLFRFGRCYPTYWEPDGQGGHCAKNVQWLSAEGNILAMSDYENRERYLSFVCRYRSPCMASHWEYLLKPLVLHHSGQKGLIRYRQIEYHLMPLMAYLVMDDPESLSREEFVQLGLASAPSAPDSPLHSGSHLRDFEERFCYDRYWNGQGREQAGTRFMCTGRVFTMVGDRNRRTFIGRKTDLEQFRHEYFLLFLISHFHRAALLMLQDRLVDVTNRLEVESLQSVRTFRRTIRQMLGIFLRFTQRYWFREVSDHTQAKELFRMVSEHLSTQRLYDEVRTAIEDMNQYLDSDALRRQGETMVRLTVVATVGLIGVATTGFLGMNLFAMADESAIARFLVFMLVLIVAFIVTFYTVLKSSRLADFLEALADERRSSKAKLAAFTRVWNNTLSTKKTP
ncbi:hypothetical protein W02_00280 [Nitrospira sp. KM1]|uniref:CorA family divalent cation transporter n=1 Tax=Nitrospira sp. KM1 TaxID=1936990 RepID=UPI0013A72FD7|nr:CorA family divalent cation transporter [Nitrospira sp. KM1]BCA52888.1 hypothetical protein W02_00280 [Nitrospira sp. KM1]